MQLAGHLSVVAVKAGFHTIGSDVMIVPVPVPVLLSDRDDHVETLLRLFETILTSEANRSSRQKRVLSLRPDCVTRNCVTETILTLEKIIWKPGFRKQIMKSSTLQFSEERKQRTVNPSGLRASSESEVSKSSSTHLHPKRMSYTDKKRAAGSSSNRLR